MKISIRASNK